MKSIKNSKSKLLNLVLLVGLVFFGVAYMCQRQDNTNNQDEIDRLTILIEENAAIAGQLHGKINLLEDSILAKKQIIDRSEKKIDSLKRISRSEIRRVETLPPEEALEYFSTNTGGYPSRLQIGEDTTAIVPLSSIRIANIHIAENNSKTLLILEYEKEIVYLKELVSYYDSAMINKDSLIVLHEQTISLQEQRTGEYVKLLEEQEKVFRKTKRKLIIGMVGEGIVVIGLLAISIL